MELLIPKHIAIIPDGNRRWAVLNKKKIFLGHKEGSKTTEYILRSAFEAGIQCFTIWGASEDNLTKRDALEIRALSQVFIKALSKLEHSKDIKKYDVSIRVRGAFKNVLKNKELNTLAQKIESSTKNNKGRILTILLGYDGRTEMKHVIESFQKTGKEISDNSICSSLFTGSLPPVDLVIRTGGEPHWSAGFMMWLTSNSEFYFTNTLWPDFSSEEFSKALKDFSKRRRMMGK